MSLPLLLPRWSVAILLSLAYVVLGWLSLRVAIPPDYVSLVFVPSGLAFVAALVWGRIGLLGVVLGSLLLNAASNWQNTHLLGGGLLQWNLLVTPLAAGLQAGLSAWAVRRWVGYPNALDTPGRVLGFLALGGPLGCLVNASLSVPLLVYLGIVQIGRAHV